MRRKHSLIALAALVGSAFALISGTATAAQFASGFGFDPAGLGGLPETMIDRTDPFETAGDETELEAPYGVDLAFTDDLCILAAGSSACAENAQDLTDAYSVIMSFQVSAVNAASITGDFLLVVTDFSDPTGQDQFGVGDLFVELNPTAPGGLDTSGTNSIFDGSFDPFVHVIDIDSNPPASPQPGYSSRYDYIGWQLTMGDVDSRVISLRYEVTNPAANFAIPKLRMNAIPTSIIPEPGTALMLGLGLAGLASVRRREGTD